MSICHVGLGKISNLLLTLLALKLGIICKQLQNSMFYLTIWQKECNYQKGCIQIVVNSEMSFWFIVYLKNINTNVGDTNWTKDDDHLHCRCTKHH